MELLSAVGQPMKDIDGVSLFKFIASRRAVNLKDILVG